ncbi:MAG: diguanylate cyclase [Pseudomonadota bacterium]
MSNHNELIASQRILSMLETACEISEQIIDNVPSVFVVLNGKNHVIRANKAFCDLVGCTIEDALHLDFTSLFNIENRDILLHHIGHLRDGVFQHTGTHVKLEIGGVRDDQPAKPFSWRISQIEHISQADGAIISIVGDDLSSLYQSELKLMSIFSSIPIGMMVVNHQGTIMEVLSEYCHILLNCPLLIGESLKAVLSANNDNLSAELIQIFDILHTCIGKPMTSFAEHEKFLSMVNLIPIAGNHQIEEKWVKPRFQPIVKNNVIDRYMVIIEDGTASFLAQQKIEKADLLGKQAQALYECAIRDPLSGLYTRLFMNDSIKRLIAAANRGNFHELTLVIFDIDNFKSINDVYGHAVGDLVIKELGRIILTSTRDTDVAVRYGGEEFVLALPNNIPDQRGRIVAERIRQLLENTPIEVEDGKVFYVTTSCGVAYCHNSDTLESLIARADKYLYIAKQSGKNRVCVETQAD